MDGATTTRRTRNSATNAAHSTQLATAKAVPTAPCGRTTVSATTSSTETNAQRRHGPVEAVAITSDSRSRSPAVRCRTGRRDAAIAAATGSSCVS